MKSFSRFLAAAAPAEAFPGAGLIGRRVLRSTISNYLGKFAWLLSGFLLAPFMLRYLGTTDYGIWALSGSLVAYGSVLDFGVSGAVIKYVAEYRAKRDAAQLRSVVATAFFLYVALSLL